MEEMVEDVAATTTVGKIEPEPDDNEEVTPSQSSPVRNGNFPKDFRLVSVASVIQQNQPSVIQSTNLNAVQLGKGNVILVQNKSGGVIQAANQNIQALQVVPKGSGDGKIEYLQLVNAEELEEVDTSDPKKRREILARRPSYRKILNDLSGTEIANDPEKRRELLARQPSYRKILSDLGAADVVEEKSSDSPSTSESSQETESNTVTVSASQTTYAPLLKVIPAGSLTLTSTEGGITAGNLQTLTMTSAGSTTGAIVHYAHAQDNQFIVPDERFHTTVTEDAQQKREMRLVKNREAARECRRKKKEYIKCLESRVAVLENQNKALIEELKGLKELYCEKQG